MAAVMYVHHLGVIEEMGTPGLGRSEEGREKGSLRWWGEVSVLVPGPWSTWEGTEVKPASHDTGHQTGEHRSALKACAFSHPL